MDLLVFCLGGKRAKYTSENNRCYHSSVRRQVCLVYLYIIAFLMKFLLDYLNHVRRALRLFRKTCVSLKLENYRAFAETFE